MANSHKRIVVAAAFSIAAVASAMGAPVMAQEAKDPQYPPVPAFPKISEMNYPGQTFEALQQVSKVFPKVEIGENLFPKVWQLFPKVE